MVPLVVDVERGPKEEDDNGEGWYLLNLWSFLYLHQEMKRLRKKQVSAHVLSCWAPVV